MKRITLARLAVLMLAVAGLVLQGCGGDDNGSGISQDMYDALNAEKTASDAAAAAAMAAQAEAEAAQMAAEAAQAAAEAEAAAAMAAQMEAEADAAAAMAAQATAEMNATAAIAAQAVAEAEAMAAKAALTKAEADLEAAEMALAAANEAKTMAETAKAVAESEARAAKEAQAAAEAAKMTAEAAQAAAETARMAAEAALTTAQAERDKYKMMYEEATAIDTVGTDVGAEGRAVATRIEAFITRGTIAELMRDDDGLSFDIKQGTTVRLDQDDMAEDMAPELDGWMGASLAKTGGGVMQEGVVYSDIDKPVTPFSSKYPYNASITDANDAATATTAGNTHHYVLALTTTAQAISGSGSVDPRISITTGLSSDIPSRMLDIADNTATPMTLRGKYDGVPGQYVCTGATDATCTLMWTADGITITGNADTTDLLFKADNIETLIPDPDHLTFGVWMLSPDGPAAGGFIRPIANANAPMFGQMHLKALKGSATYKGDATGYYATRDAGSAEATSGRFTATAMLKADFDAAHEDVPAMVDGTNALPTATTATALTPRALTASHEQVSSTGEVSATSPTTRYLRPAVPDAGVSFAGSKIYEFMDADGNMMEGWVVNLNGGFILRPDDIPVMRTGADGALDVDAETGDIADAYNAALRAAGNAGEFAGWTSGTGGAYEWSGNWYAEFHGTNRATTPTGVVGTFRAVAGSPDPVNDEGAINLLNDDGFVGVVGGFGARKE